MRSPRGGREKEGRVEEGKLFAHHSKESAPHQDLPILHRSQPHAVKSNLHCPPDFGLLLNAEEAHARTYSFPPSTATIMKIPGVFQVRLFALTRHD